MKRKEMGEKTVLYARGTELYGRVRALKVRIEKVKVTREGWTEVERGM
jgi:hypothetical protein